MVQVKRELDSEEPSPCLRHSKQNHGNEDNILTRTAVNSPERPTKRVKVEHNRQVDVTTDDDRVVDVSADGAPTSRHVPVAKEPLQENRSLEKRDVRTKTCHMPGNLYSATQLTDRRLSGPGTRRIELKKPQITRKTTYTEKTREETTAAPTTGTRSNQAAVSKVSCWNKDYIKEKKRKACEKRKSRNERIKSRHSEKPYSAPRDKPNAVPDTTDENERDTASPSVAVSALDLSAKVTSPDVPEPHSSGTFTSAEQSTGHVLPAVSRALPPVTTREPYCAPWWSGPDGIAPPGGIHPGAHPAIYHWTPNDHVRQLVAPINHPYSGSDARTDLYSAIASRERDETLLSLLRLKENELALDKNPADPALISACHILIASIEQKHSHVAREKHATFGGESGLTPTSLHRHAQYAHSVHHIPVKNSGQYVPSPASVKRAETRDLLRRHMEPNCATSVLLQDSAVNSRRESHSPSNDCLDFASSSLGQPFSWASGDFFRNIIIPNLAHGS